MAIQGNGQYRLITLQVVELDAEVLRMEETQGTMMSRHATNGVN